MTLSELIKPTDVVLDLCCGSCNFTKKYKTRFSIGIDIHEPYLEQRDGFMPLCQDVVNIDRMFLPNSFDVVLCMDGIEHMTEGAALHMLKSAELIAKRSVIIFTPNESTITSNDNYDPYQKHISCWPESYWIGRGYETKVFVNKTKGCPMVLAWMNPYKEMI